MSEQDAWTLKDKVKRLLLVVMMVGVATVAIIAFQDSQQSHQHAAVLACAGYTVYSDAWSNCMADNTH